MRSEDGGANLFHFKYVDYEKKFNGPCEQTTCRKSERDVRSSCTRSWLNTEFGVSLRGMVAEVTEVNDITQGE